jgi:TPR repeat protein
MGRCCVLSLDAEYRRLLAEGENLRKRPAALKALRRLAEGGHRESQYLLGTLYHWGDEVLRRDYARARRWYMLAGEQGHAGAMNNLAVLMARGLGGPMDARGAVGWYKRASRRGDADAAYNLGSCYEMGSGVRRDFAAARRWYRVAAQRGSGDAAFNLGAMSCRGAGGRRELVRGREWYQVAKRLGVREARERLAMLELEGA